MRILTLGQLTHGGDWQIELAHDRPEHLLIWITRGQGLALFDGARHGVGMHNALFVPAGNLMALHPGRQSFGQVVLVHPDADLGFPARPWHLRIRDVVAQKEMTALFEAMSREQTAALPRHTDAVAAHARLMAIWLHRRLEASELPPATRAQHLMQRFCARIVTTGAAQDSIAAHAQALGVTATHLNRVCRAETGMTASALVTERLVHGARRMLTGGDLPVAAIARHLGFASAAYFSRFVVQHTGQTPSALRRDASGPAAAGARARR